MKNKSKILVLDIETRPITAYVWRLFDENIGVEQIVDPGGMICFAAKWLGKRGIEFYSDWDDGHEEMVNQAHRLISEADAVVTYNGDKFDIQKLNGEFLMQDLEPPPPVTSIDVIKTIRKMGFPTARLAYVGPLLTVGSKIKNEGFPLWRKVMDGDETAQKRMRRYCIQDVRLLAQLYNHIRPYIRNHPHLGAEGKAGGCGACGSRKLQSRGYRRTKAFKIQRLQCQSCGAWQDGTRTKIK